MQCHSRPNRSYVCPVGGARKSKWPWFGHKSNRGHFNFQAPPWRPDRAKIWTICWTLILLDMDFFSIWTFRLNPNPFTLESGIDIAPGINVAPLLKNVHIRILIHSCINQGSTVIFLFSPTFIPELHIRALRKTNSFSCIAKAILISSQPRLKKSI